MHIIDPSPGDDIVGQIRRLASEGETSVGIYVNGFQAAVPLRDDVKAACAETGIRLVPLVQTKNA